HRLERRAAPHEFEMSRHLRSVRCAEAQRSVLGSCTLVMPLRLSDPETCVDAILERLGTHIVLGVPLGVGKPNTLLNALYARAKRDKALRLDILTALSLNPPRGKSELEERFFAP